MKRIASIFCLILILLASVACNSTEQPPVGDPQAPSTTESRTDVNVSACEKKYQTYLGFGTKIELGQPIPTRYYDITCTFTEIKFEDGKMRLKADLTNTSDSEVNIYHLYRDFFGNEHDFIFQILNSGETCDGNGSSASWQFHCDTTQSTTDIPIPSGESVKISAVVDGVSAELEDDFYVTAVLIQGTYWLEIAGTKG